MQNSDLKAAINTLTPTLGSGANRAKRIRDGHVVYRPIIKTLPRRTVEAYMKNKPSHFADWKGEMAFFPDRKYRILVNGQYVRA